MRKGYLFLILDTLWARMARKWRWEETQWQYNVTVARVDLCAKTGGLSRGHPVYLSSWKALQRAVLEKTILLSGLHSDSFYSGKEIVFNTQAACVQIPDVPCTV